MKLCRHSLFATTTMLAALASLPAAASLQPRLDGQAVYHSDLNITWLADAGGAGSPRGLMTWAQAEAWVQGFSLGGATEWRLPATVNPDSSCQDPASSSGFNCTGSEMGHLFYVELSGIAGQPVSDGLDPDLDLFSNLIGADWWSGTSFTIPELAWNFRFASGLQDAKNKSTFTFFAWPVHDGDVFAVEDADNDGVQDSADNCTFVANGNQLDSNGDNIGNACDADITNDCAVNFADLAALKTAFFPNPADPDADFNGDGLVNFGDLALMKATFFSGPNPGPGPSGLANDCD